MPARDGVGLRPIRLEGMPANQIGPMRAPREEPAGRTEAHLRCAGNQLDWPGSLFSQPEIEACRPRTTYVRKYTIFVGRDTTMSARNIVMSA